MLVAPRGLVGMWLRHWVRDETINIVYSTRSHNLAIGLMILSFIHSRGDVVHNNIFKL